MRFPINLVLDTNIFSNNKYSFETNGFYKALKQMIKQHKIKLFMSRVVVEEVRAHLYSELLDEIENVYNRINKLRNCFPNSFYESFGFPAKPTLDKHYIDVCLESFISDFEAEIMEYGDISIEQIFSDYFERKPPFEEKKKDEFPDSIIFHQVKKTFNSDNPVYVLCKDFRIVKSILNIKTCLIILLVNMKDMNSRIKKYPNKYLI